MNLRITVGGAVLALTAALVAGTVAPAAAADPTITAQLNRSTGVFWDGIGPDQPADTVVVSGVLTDAEGHPVPGAEVLVYRAIEVDEDFDLVATPTTDAQGRYSVETRVLGNSFYQAQHEAAPGSFVGSDVVGLSAMRDLNAVKVRRDGRVWMNGRVMPSWREKPVHLQRRTCSACVWRDVRTERTGPHGGFTFGLVRPAADGKVWAYRAWTVRNERFQRSTGAVLRVMG